MRIYFFAAGGGYAKEYTNLGVRRESREEGGRGK